MLIPEGESSKAKHSCGCWPISFNPSRYGSGKGLGRVHSSPSTILGKYSVAPMPLSMLIQFAFGALETAANGRPDALIQSRNCMKPGRGFRFPAAHAQDCLSRACQCVIDTAEELLTKATSPESSLKRASLSSENLSCSACVRSGHRKAERIELWPPVICSSKNFLVIGSPLLYPL